MNSINVQNVLFVNQPLANALNSLLHKASLYQKFSKMYFIKSFACIQHSSYTLEFWFK